MIANRIKYRGKPTLFIMEGGYAAAELGNDAMNAMAWLDS